MEIKKDSFQALADLLRGHRVIIQTHDFPDPDAIASACALKELLSYKGIPSEVMYFGKIEKINIKMILDMFDLDVKDAKEQKDLSADDYVVTVDGQKNNSNFTNLIGNEVACIDHHPFVTDHPYAFIRHEITGACASIITHWIMEEHMPVSKELATLLLYGIKMDTRNFSAGVTHYDITAFDFLNGIADIGQISHLDNSVLELSDLRAYGAAIESISIYDNVGFSYIPFSCPDGLIASVCEFILSLSSVQMAVVYAERNGGLKFSVRSEVPELNAGKLLHIALKGIGNGGGHMSMAGGLVYPDQRKTLGETRFMEAMIRERILNAYHDLSEEREHV
ncbi:MAG: DHH family phosphoesterase [Lachnospiraceae bacterium]|nr:DHH family phosphoesterase [Lachnospiraceae bacterium]